MSYDFDVETYQEANTREVPEHVGAFLESSFMRSLNHQARKAIAEGYPKPATDAIQVPSADSVLVDLMGTDFPKK